MNFGAPLYLYTLAAIAVPVAIHLWSKHTKTKIAFGSLRFLRETETKTSRQLFPSELLLLAIRLLIIGCLALVFAEPMVQQATPPRVAYLIDPNLTSEAIEKIVAQTDPQETYWLGPVKSPIAAPLPFRTIDVWSSLTVFEDYDSLVVFSTQSLRQFQGKQLPLTSSIRWVNVPTESKKTIVHRLRKHEESLKIQAAANAGSLLFEQLPGQGGAPLQVNVYLHADENQRELSALISKAMAAIQHSSPISWKLKQWSSRSQPNPDDWLIWLTEDKAPTRKRLIRIDSLAPFLDKKSKYIFGLQPNISIESMMQHNFPLQLETALLQPLNDELDAYDLRTIPEHYLSAGTKTTASIMNRSLTEGALIAFLLLLLIERLVSQITIRK